MAVTNRLMADTGGRSSGDEGEGVNMAGTDDSEVTVVERGHGGYAQLLGNGHDAGVNHAQAEISVTFDERNTAVVVGQCEIDDGEFAGSDQPQEADLG